MLGQSVPIRSRSKKHTARLQERVLTSFLDTVTVFTVRRTKTPTGSNFLFQALFILFFELHDRLTGPSSPVLFSESGIFFYRHGQGFVYQGCRFPGATQVT